MSEQTGVGGDANPYAAPRARLDDAAGLEPGAEPFFAVSVPKLAIMSVATFNFYPLFWFYRNWKCAQRVGGETLNAPLRALFYPFTAYGLFRRIREHAAADGRHASLPAGPLATVLLSVSLTAGLPDPFWFVSLLVFVPLLPVQRVVNEMNARLAPDADTNASFTGWNIVALVLGTLLLLLAVAGLILVE